MKTLLQRVLLAGTAGYIMYCFSEIFFWTRPTESNPLGYLAGWLLYSFLTYTLFTVIDYFRVRTIWALFLAGAVYGWLIEGVVMQTMYDSLPWQISFTGLSWHAMITVLVGWFYARKILLKGQAHKTILLSIGLGLFYGVWSLNTWVLDKVVVTPLPDYTVFVIVSTLVLIVSYALFDRIEFEEFRPSRIEIGIQIAAYVAYFLFVTIPAQILAVFLLPPLLALTYFTLRKNRQTETRANILVSTQGRTEWWNYLLLVSVPGIAIPFYALALHAQFIRYFDLVYLVSTGIYVVTAVLGAILYALSLYKVWAASRTAS
jgi:hypothetical protein